MAYPGVAFAEFLISNRRPYLLGPAEDADLVGSAPRPVPPDL